MDGDDVSPYTIPAAAMASWMANPKYSRYLQHYEEVQKWMAEYTASWKQCCTDQAALNHQQNSSYGIYGQHNWSPTTQPNNYHSRHLRHKKQRPNRKSLRSKRRAKWRNDNKSTNMDCSEGQDDGYELEVSEEMKQFIATTEEFRRQREKARAKGKLFTGEKVKTVQNMESTPIGGSPVDDVDYQVVNDNVEMTEREVTCSESEDAMTSAPKERPGVRRIAEMKELYGRHAAAIHGMETAIQLQFDRHYDRKRPALWPIVPLKM